MSQEVSEILSRSDDEPCVVQISDCHLGRVSDDDPSGPDAMLRCAVAGAVELRPDLLLLTGDIADDGSRTAYERVRSILADASVRATVMVTPGNHDDRATLADTFPTPTEVAVGGWRVLTIDTAICGKEHGRVDADEVLDRLGESDGPPTLLAMHHPLITTSTHPWFRVEGAADLVAALSHRNDVRLVLSGHLHEAFNVVLGDVAYVGCSSTWYAIKHQNDRAVAVDGHVGALVVRLRQDGTFGWNRLPDPLAGRPSLV